MANQHASGKIGVLVGQVGTPDSADPGDVRRYLRNFLSDPRVVDYHPALWKPILHTLVLRTRPARSAELYRTIWTDEGSPLLLNSIRQVAGMQERLGDAFHVELGMAYSGPSIPDAINRMQQTGIDRIVVLPLFPQFSTATTASVFDEVYSAASGRRWNAWRIRKKSIPALRFVGPYFDEPHYIRALVMRTREAVRKLPEAPDKFVLSFHGLPDRYAREGDPYPEQCKRTAELLAHAMRWRPEQWTLTFQSRFGREEWLRPYTSDVLAGLCAQGVKRPCVIAPSFVTDCLETLQELGIEGRESFAHGGGDSSSYTLVPSLNDAESWLDFLADIVERNAQGWEPASFHRTSGDYRDVPS